MATTAWPYLEYMAQWERQVERRQLFLRSYHFSRDAEVSPRARTRRVVWAGARRLRRAAAKGLRRLRARIRLCFGWAAPAPWRRPRVPLRPPPPEGAAGGRECRVRVPLVAARLRAAAWS